MIKLSNWFAKISDYLKRHSGVPCGRKLADGQWYHFCGETDMGQTSPALCTRCDGTYKLAKDSK